jgi:hypothetical protein
MGRQETWRQSAARRRDERSAKGPSDISPGVGRKKNTKLWCGGHVGREHTPKCVDFDSVKGSAIRVSFVAPRSWKLLICTKCGKELAHYYPMRIGSRPSAPPPVWVED